MTTNITIAVEWRGGAYHASGPAGATGRCISSSSEAVRQAAAAALGHDEFELKEKRPGVWVVTEVESTEGVK